jgi:glycosyltransferase involved in cell wall biosynthesis
VTSPSSDSVRLVFIHPSDELYGADRILLDLHAALTPAEQNRAEFWLPSDVTHPARPLSAELGARGATVRHLDLPILRRAYRTPRGVAGLARRWVHTLRALRAARPAIVYLTTSAAYLCAPAARLAGASRVIGHKQEIWSKSDALVLGTFARACHRLITISSPVHDNLPPSLRRRAVMVLNATKAPVSYETLDGRTGPLTYTVASRWNTWKGHRTLLAAWDVADEPGHLVVLGGPPPSGNTVDVALLATQLRHPDSVTIVGEVSDIGPHLDASDIVVVPSDCPEPFGLVAIEAFARARPVIGSSAGGLADIITDTSDGWIFPPSHVEELAKIFDHLHRDDVHRAGRNARSSYEARFTIERYTAEWRDGVGL